MLESLFDLKNASQQRRYGPDGVLADVFRL